MSSSVISEVQKERKTLPVKYKAMLFTCLSFIANHVESEELRNDLYSKLPLFKSIEEQIAYFDESVDIKKVEVTIYKPMVNENKKKVKAENAPVKEKKPRAPRKKKTVEEVVLPSPPPEEEFAEPELEFEQAYPDARLSNKEPVKDPELVKEPVKKVKAKPKEKDVSETDDVKVKKARAPRKEKKKDVVVEAEEPKETEEEAGPRPTEEELYMVPSDIITSDRGVFWTTDEDYRNGKIYASSDFHDDENNGVGKLVGKLVDGIPIFD